MGSTATRQWRTLSVAQIPSIGPGVFRQFIPVSCRNTVAFTPRCCPRLSPCWGRSGVGGVGTFEVLGYCMVPWIWTAFQDSGDMTSLQSEVGGLPVAADRGLRPTGLLSLYGRSDAP